MAIEIRGNGGEIAEVNSDHEVLVALTGDPDKTGFAAAAAEVHSGDAGAPRLVRELDASPDYRLRVGMDGLYWADVFNHGQFNISKYKGVDTTMTKAMAGGRLALNSGNATASGNATQVQTWKTFPLHLSYGLYWDAELLFTQDPVANNVCEAGMGYATGVATPTDGAFFRLNAAGVLLGVINNNGSETSVILAYVPASNVLAHYLIVLHNDVTEFWIDDVLYGSIPTPSAIGSPCLSMNLPILLREYNANTAAIAQRMEIASISVSSGDVDRMRMWATTMAGMGLSAINIPDSVVAGQTANYANSAAPASATLSNTAAGYTTLGGQFQFAAVAGAETDYALFGYQVPAGAANVPAKNLVVRGIRIETFNMGAAVATSPTLLQWAIGVGSSAVSLATADSATAGTRAARRLALGVQSLPVGAAIGAATTPVDVNLDAPLVVEPGTFLHVILKMPVGAATASEIIRGTVMINGFFE